MRGQLKLSSSLPEQLKEKSRRRRGALTGLSEAAVGLPQLRNDPYPELELIYLPIDSLAIPSRRLRKRDVSQIAEIARSITAFGMNEPLLLGTGDTIVHAQANFRRG